MEGPSAEGVAVRVEPPRGGAPLMTAGAGAAGSRAKEGDPAGVRTIRRDRGRGERARINKTVHLHPLTADSSQVTARREAGARGEGQPPRGHEMSPNGNSGSGGIRQIYLLKSEI
ncbi:Hypothetical protein NTJ_01624 [Nesidiocoris tenuis]|uniref:Uncharacterized protein n=1 Tax=Nesidiocoris tenuis TaxID=355587 RepID=A0ABN7AC42_9HEMI|nr:Hypothetical protein NTJ_01624 [Nesidiocoris tenuis]